MSIFTGAGVAIVTPMNQDGTVNYEVFGQIVEEQIAGGTDCIIVCGTTGESATLPIEEHKKLIELYRADGKYSNALENARMLLQLYGDQARNDGIAEVAADLEKLASGKNEAMVAKESEYRKAGGTNTPEGRRAGTELVILYAKSSVTSGGNPYVSYRLNTACVSSTVFPAFFVLQMTHYVL
mgnify:CR=1 FL=1